MRHSVHVDVLLIKDPGLSCNRADRHLFPERSANLQEVGVLFSHQ